MQVKHWDGSTELLDALKDASEPYETDIRKRLEQIAEKLAKPEVESVALHKPGSIVTHSDGRRYRVTDSGAWERVDE